MPSPPPPSPWSSLPSSSSSSSPSTTSLSSLQQYQHPHPNHQYHHHQPDYYSQPHSGQQHPQYRRQPQQPQSPSARGGGLAQVPIHHPRALPLPLPQPHHNHNHQHHQHHQHPPLSSSPASRLLPPPPFQQQLEPAQASASASSSYSPSPSSPSAAATMQTNNMHYQLPPSFAAPPNNAYAYHHSNGAAAVQPGGGASSSSASSNSDSSAMPMPAAMVPGTGGLATRVPIPPPPANIAASGRRGESGKVIKRRKRTKTGCLTCRQRRIKCDERHPTCVNCERSKRNCLGYDPIFRGHQPGLSMIQPAPASTSTSSDQQYYSNPHGNHSTNLPFYQPIYNGTFSYGPTVDSTLSGPDTSTGMAPQAARITLQPSRILRPITIDQLFSLQNIPPQFHHRDTAPQMSSAMQHEVQEFYRIHYALALDRFFETNWYGAGGLAHLQNDLVLRDFVAQCAEQFKSRSADADAIRQMQSLEARLVWLLASMPRAAADSSSSSSGPAGSMNSPPPDLLPRIDVVENLLTGQFLPPHRIPAPPPPPPHQINNHQKTQNPTQTFWHALGRFTAARDDSAAPPPPSSTGPTATAAAGGNHDLIATSLAEMCGALNLTESRDVLYSIAVARHLGGRVEGGFERVRQSLPRGLVHPPPVPVGNGGNGGDEEEISRLAVAAEFVVNEDARGMTQVVQTVCRMAVRSWALMG